MEKAEIIEFFDRLAPTWDAEMVRNDRIINTILDYAGIREGVRVLDVACGTGVLFPDYLKRNVYNIVGVDISTEMIKIAEKKFKDERIMLICKDVQELYCFEEFDCAVVYNAFPHFPEPEGLLSKISECLVPGGRVTVAHGMSREKINAHHQGSASKVSVGLMPAQELADLMSRWFRPDVVVSDNEKFIVSGTKV